MNSFKTENTVGDDIFNTGSEDAVNRLLGQV